MNFLVKLKAQIQKSNSLVCVGLDPDLAKIPAQFKTLKYPQFEFNKYIIEKTYPHACAYKPNSAFYEATGDQGVKQLKLTCNYLKKNHPSIPIILDAKRADIGHTNQAYKQYIFNYLQVDAVTLNPYLGISSLATFLEEKNKGIILLVKTSNPQSGEFQDLLINKKPLWQIIASNIVNKWSSNQNCLFVIGATYPSQLKTVRKIAPHTFFLIPGIGKQGGDIKKTLENGLCEYKSGLIINSSRSIIFANNPEKAVIDLKNQINQYR